MKIVIAPDSFKESLSAAEVAAAIAAGLGEVWPWAELLCRPMADGGEGTVEAVIAAVGGERRETLVRGPLGEPVAAHWGWIAESRSAVIEMAAASGLHLVPASRRDALRSCTYGTGELILAALEAGAERIVLGFGGSATNDAGSGMLRALGVRFEDAEGRPLPPGGAALAQLQRINPAGLDPRLAKVDFEVACDVDNPLCGPRGASHVFGPQKGATPEQVRQLDAALGRFADVCAATLGRDARDSAGSGAAGGIGFAARTFLGAAFRPGIELVAEVSGLEQAVIGADLVITGEGRIDEQTLHGKTPMGVAGIAKRHGVPVVALAGMLGEGYERLYGHGIDVAFSLAPGPISLASALAEAPVLLRRRAADIARLWQLARG
ncbi:Glycerate kinase [Azotobacter vinelandii CA]|uniref:Glycerate kinase n=2 Tax=Azotobacter vinelandii TaxID=354 RepID=C1DFR4_AZOVD|nr:glycerate kinase [Azotobacter vinelandii]ACO80460.1 Glycerate kinase [Azotobacter vinelandii DJ]AGK14097.1 Glycerate kinase [Azotobacter vinelandii CA]AGK18995.1 Glycerate kinase [Azotobacter vinelandii CA6]WKN21216.1 glycerate kinase [Azotobacter vinelandii]SFX70527.1 glycerate kinase [Azotobacter vinelandii]